MNRDNNNNYASMVGLFVASNVANILLKTASSYASSRNQDATATLIQNIAPYIDNAFKFIHRLDANSRMQTWEKDLDQKLLDIQTQIASLKR